MDASVRDVLWHSNDADARDHCLEEELKDPTVAAARRASNVRAQLIRKLSELRVGSGISQKVVANKMGTTQSAVSDLEKGITDPRLTTLLRYAEALGYRLELEIHEDVGKDLVDARKKRRTWLSRVHFRSWRNRTLTYDFAVMRAPTNDDLVDLWTATAVAADAEADSRERRSSPPSPPRGLRSSYEIDDIDLGGLLAHG